jgi:hypothetical protein
MVGRLWAWRPLGEKPAGRKAITMKKVLIYVEGQTEETFVRDVLAPFLWQKCQIVLTPTLARTKRTKSGQTFKGGIVSYEQVKRDILRLLGDSSAVLVTTMIDYYGLPNDFPGKASLPAGTPYERVQYLEQAFKNDIGHSKFLPFLVLHEFEAFVLVNPENLGRVLPLYKNRLSNLVTNIGSIPPEEINEGADTHPSARILQHLPGYQKRLHGPRVVQHTGLSTIRNKCPHFKDWLIGLENLCKEEE